MDREEIEPTGQQVARAWEKTKHFLQKAQEELLKISQIGKIQVDKTFLRRERLHLIQMLGEETFRLLREGKIDVPELKGLSQQIEKTVKRIEEDVREVRRLSSSLGPGRRRAGRTLTPSPAKGGGLPSPQKGEGG